MKKLFQKANACLFLAMLAFGTVTYYDTHVTRVDIMKAFDHPAFKQLAAFYKIFDQ